MKLFYIGLHSFELTSKVSLMNFRFLHSDLQTMFLNLAHLVEFRASSKTHYLMAPSTKFFSRGLFGVVQYNGLLYKVQLWLSSPDAQLGSDFYLRPNSPLFLPSNKYILLLLHHSKAFSTYHDFDKGQTRATATCCLLLVHPSSTR